MTARETPTFVARSSADLIALVPVVLGFHPEDSVVLMTFGPPGTAFHARIDLPVELAEQEEVADVLRDAVVANRVRRAAVLLYTDDVAAAESQARALVVRLLGADIEVVDVVRVEDGHWFEVPEDGTAGTPYDLETHPFTAQHVFAGRMVHRDRAALADTLVGTDDADAAEVALAATRFADLGLAQRDAPGGGRAFLRVEAGWLRARIRSHVDDERRLGATDAGRMLVLASILETRDVAWAEIARPEAGVHVDLWRDLVRRAPRDLLPGAAALLAFAAWQHGDGALAWCAIDRCLEVDPDYSMAHLVADALTGAVPPDAWQGVHAEDLPLLAEEVSAGQRRDCAS